MEKIQISEENPTTYTLLKQELGEEPFNEMEETLKDNKKEMDHLRQELNEMRRYIISKDSIHNISEVRNTFSVDSFAI